MGKIASVIDKLKAFPWHRYVKFAYLTGSWAEGKRGRDVDIIISPVDLETYGELLEALVKHLGVVEDQIDLIPLTPRTPCPFVLDALPKAIPLYVEDIDYVLRIFNVCQDWYIDYKKLGLHEALLEAIG